MSRMLEAHCEHDWHTVNWVGLDRVDTFCRRCGQAAPDGIAAERKVAIAEAQERAAHERQLSQGQPWTEAERDALSIGVAALARGVQVAIALPAVVMLAVIVLVQLL